MARTTIIKRPSRYDPDRVTPATAAPKRYHAARKQRRLQKGDPGYHAQEAKRQRDYRQRLRQRERAVAELELREQMTKDERRDKAIDDLCGVVPASETFNYDNPDVAMHLAKVIFGCEMDYGQAIRRLRPGLYSDDFLSAVADLQANEHVQLALQHLLKQAGLNDESRVEYVKIIWQWMRGEEREMRMQAARILSKIYFDNQQAGAQPQTLHIEGFDDGLKRLLGGGAQQPMPAPTSVDANDPDLPIDTDALVLLPGKSE